MNKDDLKDILELLEIGKAANLEVEDYRVDCRKLTDYTPRFNAAIKKLKFEINFMPTD